MNPKITQHDVLSLITPVAVVWITTPGLLSAFLIGFFCGYMRVILNMRDQLESGETGEKSEKNTEK